MTFVPRVKRLFKDLRRRRVFRVAAAYLAVAFVALQVAEIVFPALALDRGLTIAVIVAIAGFPLTIILAWLYDLSPMGVVRTPPITEAEEADAADDTRRVRVRKPDLDRSVIAVLPFAMTGSAEEDRYFSEGIHEDILTSLSKVSEIRVVSRNSVLRYKDETPDPRQLGRELEVGSVLEGSVRRVGRKVRITARLVDTRAGQTLWAESYDRSLDDIFGIQADVALQIVGALRAELSPEEAARLRSAPTDDFEAYDLYLRGRHLWNERTDRGLREAVEPLRAAVERDPGFVLAHAALADAYLTQGLYNLTAPVQAMPKALEAARRALELDPGLGEARAARGCVRALFEWDWDKARDDLEASARLSPSYPTARQWLAIHVLAPLGLFDDAEQALAEAATLDPASLAVGASAVFVAYLDRRYGEAEERCRTLLQRVPAFALGHQFLGLTLVQAGDPEEGLESLRQASRLRGGKPEIQAAIAPALVALGRVDEALAILADLEAKRAEEYVAATRLARVRVALHETDAALEDLETAMEERATDLVWAAWDPELDELRGHPRFEALLSRMGLADRVSAPASPRRS